MRSFKEFLEATMADNGEGQRFWAGNQGASGILPIASNSGKICLAWRSNNVHLGNCWGTLGGAIGEGMTPVSSAIQEMQEETGYSGAVHTIPAFVFTSGSFKYYNFIGVVPNEFPFNPGNHSWETNSIDFMDYNDILSEIQTNPHKFHPGLIALFKNSKDLIEKTLEQIHGRT